MKKSIFTIMSLVLSSAAFADGMPPGAVGMPARHPCDNAQAEAAAKETLAHFDTYFRTHRSPVARSSVSGPTVGSCRGNLREMAGVPIRGVMIPVNRCGITYVINNQPAAKKFSKWALDAIQSHAVETNAPICVQAPVTNRRPTPQPGDHVVRGVIIR
jgi:hypothetical protein